MTREPSGNAAISCAEVDELLGSYALDALEPEERATVAAHLESCELHEELRALQRTAAAVGFAIAPVDPPASLRARIAAIAEPTADEQRVPEASARPRWFATLWRPSTAYALAAVLAVIALVAGVGIGINRGDAATQVVAVTDNAGGGDHRLLYMADHRVAVLEVRGLEDLQPGETYQVWLIRGDGDPQSLGLFTTSSGAAEVAFSVELEEGDVIAVTVEPAGGSPLPTSTPLIHGTA